VNTKDISLSIYSFGYAAGFISDSRPEAARPMVALDNIADIASQSGLGGIEFPVDRHYPIDQMDKAEAFILKHRCRGMRTAVDLETFDPDYVRALLPVVVRAELGFVRIKMAGMYGGNRYAEPLFAAWTAEFIQKLKDIVPALKASGVRLLIENHQDLGADDLLDIIHCTSAAVVGINWDIGNSLAVLDTPASFLEKCHEYIGNIHLKDYQLYKRPNGFAMKRCALGSGVAELDRIIPQARRLCGRVPMAIELGAQHARCADVFERCYWEAYPACSVVDKIGFFSFLNTNTHSGDSRSAWELGLTGEEIIASEFLELATSVAFLKDVDSD
jgi:sugar phosphate isomerase/epimerase